MRIQHNISALNAHGKLGINQNAQAKNLEKLSSGFRINRAGDDAAGLAISEKMRGQIRGLNMANKNAQDGISLIQTAEGGLQETHDILQRMRELAVQSSNGTYQNEVDRENINKEVQALKSEIDRISTSTHYNGINLLDGSLAGPTNSTSALTGTQVVDYKAATATISAAAKLTAGHMIEETINIDGTNIKVDWSKLSKDDQSVLLKDFTAATASGASEADAKKAAEIMERAINDAIDASGSNVAHITVRAKGSDTGTDSFIFTSGSADRDSAIKVDAGVSTGLVASLTGIAKNTAITTTAATVHKAADMTGSFIMNIGGTDVSISTTTVNSNGSDIASVLQTAISNAIDLYNGAVTPDKALNKEDIKVSLTKDGRLEITNNTGENISFKDVDGGSVAKSLGISAEARVNNGGLTFQIGANGVADQRVNLAVGDMSSKGIGVANIDLGTRDSSNSAIDVIDKAINMVSGTRADLGALQNRLEHTTKNLTTTAENLTASESRIRDVDMAKEMMEFTKNNILSQAAQTMLAQANQQPQGVLQLLQ